MQLANGMGYLAYSTPVYSGNASDVAPDELKTRDTVEYVAKEIERAKSLFA
jgi:hypothetical protein